jgi:NTP pyrophosphatase (non-canonical NTP hydrolase)
MRHSDLVRNLKKDPEEIFQELTATRLDAMHMCLGLSGETGEAIDIVKKHVIFNKVLDRDALVKELGDIEFYLEGLRQALAITREETIEGNIAKLTKRYGEVYSDEAALNRADEL